jgi:hypothetical protein
MLPPAFSPIWGGGALFGVGPTQFFLSFTVYSGTKRRKHTIQETFHPLVFLSFHYQLFQTIPKSVFEFFKGFRMLCNSNDLIKLFSFLNSFVWME